MNPGAIREPSAARPTVLVVDDHQVVRSGVRAILEMDGGFRVVDECADGASALAACRAAPPAAVVMDARLGREDGIAAARAILAERPGCRIVMLTSFGGDELIHRALDAGIRGYLFKDGAGSELAAALRAVLAGGRYIPAEVAQRLAGSGPRVRLTDREAEVLREMSDGLRNKQIAARLGASEATVRTHVQNILGKFDCNDRGAAIATAIARGFLQPG